MNEALVANYNESAQWKVQVQRISLYIYALKNLTQKHMTYLSGILIYLFALVAVGVYKIRSVKNSEDFMVAGRTLPWYILV